MHPSNSPSASISHARAALAASLLLCALLAAVVVASFTFERSTWRTVIGDEATYIAASESLAFDGDLLFSPRDYQRFHRIWNQPPEGVILQSSDAGEHLYYAKPFYYPLFLAPFVRLAPHQGPFVANALLLVLAALLAWRALHRPLGGAAPLWVACYLFCSVAFVYVFWVHSDLFLACLSAIALALAWGPRAESLRGESAIWFAIGALLAIVTYSRPVYAVLFIPAYLAVPREARRRTLVALGAGVLLVVIASAGFYRLRVGEWTSYFGERHGFYSSTGFPGVDFPASEWRKVVGEIGSSSWSSWLATHKNRGAGWLPVSPRLVAWDLFYYLVGQNVGILPYFLPLILFPLLAPPGRERWTILGAVALGALGFVVLRSFNFYGGGASIANRYFLPLFPALWFFPRRRPRARPLTLAVAPLAVALVAAPFLWNLWARPRAFPLSPDGRYVYVTRAARVLLPFETTQSHLKPAGRDDVAIHGLWIKFLSPGARPDAKHQSLLLAPRAPIELLVGYPRPLEGVRLVISGPATARLAIHDAEASHRVGSDGSKSYELSLGQPRAVHPMWWTSHDFWLYRLDLEAIGSSSAIRVEPYPSGPPRVGRPQM